MRVLLSECRESSLCAVEADLGFVTSPIPGRAVG